MIRGTLFGTAGLTGGLGSEAGELTQRLKAAGAAHLAVDRLVGHSAVASVFAARDTRHGRPVTLKLVEPDSAYDVGAAAFVRGIGSTEELRDPHILPAGSVAGGRGAIYYVGPYGVAEPLMVYLMRSRPIRPAEVLLIAADIARALDRWHTLGLAHGEIGWAMLLMQRGQALLQPPSRITHGSDARRRDVQAFAGLCLELLDQCAEPPVGSERWEQPRAALLCAVDQPDTSLSAPRLAETLTRWAEQERDPVGQERGGLLRHVLAIAARWLRRERTPSP